MKGLFKNLEELTLEENLIKGEKNKLLKEYTKKRFEKVKTLESFLKMRKEILSLSDETLNNNSLFFAQCINLKVSELDLDKKYKKSFKELLIKQN